jgi:hypothetical protein
MDPMTLYKPRNIPTIEAIDGPGGTKVFVKDDKVVSLPNAEFDALYEKAA